MDAKTTIRLTGPAKIDGAWKKAGEEHPVDALTLQQLQDAGVVEVIAAEGNQDGHITLSPDTVLTFTQAEFDDAVAVKAKEMAGAAFDHALEQLETEAKELTNSIIKLEDQLDAATKRAEDADRALEKLKADTTETVDRLQARNAELEATIAKLMPPPEAAHAVKKAKGG